MKRWFQQKDTEANERCFSFSLFMFFSKYTSGCHIQISLAQLLGSGKSLILYRWVGQTVWADWAHLVSGALSFQSSPVKTTTGTITGRRKFAYFLSCYSIHWKWTPSYVRQGRHLCLPLTPNQDSLQQIQWYHQSKLFLSHHTIGSGLFLLLFSFIFKWKYYFCIQPYENWKCCMLFFLVEIKYFIIMGRRKHSLWFFLKAVFIVSGPRTDCDVGGEKEPWSKESFPKFPLIPSPAIPLILYLSDSTCLF